MIKRIVIALSLLLLPLTAAAQMNDFGVFISTSQWDDSTISDGFDDIDVEFDEDMGIGILYNRFWVGSFSTEFAYQRLGADLTASLEDITADVGELDLDVLSATAQLHFGRGSLFSPYVGAGAAYVSGELGSIDEEEFEDIDLENELDILLNAGVNVGLGRSFSVFLDGKYIMYEARGEGEADNAAIDVNPLIIAGGVKWRF